MFNYNYLIKYPFSNKAKEYLESKNLDLLSVDEKHLERTKFFLTTTVLSQNNEKEWFRNLKLNYEIDARAQVITYPLSRIFLSILDYTPLNQALANYYQSQLKYYLQKAFVEKRYDEVTEILEDLVPTLERQNSYYISLIDFLTLDLGNDYKLQYANLNKGKIHFNKLSDLINFVSIVLKKRILRTLDLDKKEIPKNFLVYANDVKKKYLSEAQLSFSAIDKPNISEFPPCFAKLYNDLLSGVKLSHIANFHLAVFLSNVGYSYNEILDLYKRLPNFDENIAGYQIKNILDKKYSVASCDNLKSNGLCVKECKVKHPLQLLSKKKENKK